LRTDAHDLAAQNEQYNYQILGITADTSAIQDSAVFGRTEDPVAGPQSAYNQKMLI